MIDSDIGAVRDVIKLIAQDAGLAFIRGLADVHILRADNSCKTTLWETEIKPLFTLITHRRVLIRPYQSSNLWTCSTACWELKANAWLKPSTLSLSLSLNPSFLSKVIPGWSYSSFLLNSISRTQRLKPRSPPYLYSLGLGK